MKRQPGLAILFGMAVCVAAYFLPQSIRGLPGADPLFPKSALAFAFTLIFLYGLVLFFFDSLVRLDLTLRKRATASWWYGIGIGLIFVTGLVLAFKMIPWNDEKSNLSAAEYLWQNGIGAYFDNYASINKWLGKHHPPLLVLVYGLWYKLTGFHLIAGRLFNLGFALGAAWISYRWMLRCADKAVAGLGVLCLVLTPMWCFSSASALLDMPFTFFFMAAMLFFERYLDSQSPKDASIAGVLAAVTVLSRYNGLFLFPIWGAMLLVGADTRALIKKPRTWLILAVPFALGLPWIALSIIKGSFFVQAKQLSTFLLVGFIRPGGLWYLSEVLMPLLPIMMGMYLVPLQLFGFFSAANIKDAGVRRIATGAAVYLLLVALTLPAPRYLLPAVPMLAALSSLGFWRLAGEAKGMAGIGIAAFLSTAGLVTFYTWATARDLLYIFY